MIFDDDNFAGRHRSAGDTSSGRRRSRRRRSTSSKEDGFSGHDSVEGHHHRQRASSSGRSRFEKAASLEEVPRQRGDANHIAWLWVLGLLVILTLGFGWYLQQEKSGVNHLIGDPPSARLEPLIDSLLAPLEIGQPVIQAEALEELEKLFRDARETARLDDKDIFATAATLAQILREAAEDRERHSKRLLKLGSPVSGYFPDPSARTDLPEAERKHLELAVSISWQRNSVQYRNRVEELWRRLLRFEQGRFQSSGAPPTLWPASASQLEGGFSSPAPVQTQIP